MKKALLIGAGALLLGMLPLAAQPAENVEGLSYINVPVYAIGAHQDAYVVLYGKRSLGMSQLVIPRRWADMGNGKLYIRTLENGSIGPYMTVYYRGEAFERVTLTVPLSRKHHVWGIIKYGSYPEAATLETLSLEL
jgi:hypothetical protein